MDQNFDLPNLLRLRKVTRAVTEHLASKLRSYLQSLQPLFKPTTVLGEYIRNSPKQTLKIADASLKELRSMYVRVGHAKPFRFDDKLSPPIDVFGAVPEIHPTEYEYRPQGGEVQSPITIISPMKWVLAYKGLGPRRMEELLVSQSGTARMDLQACLLHYLVMYLIASRETGVNPILHALRYAVSFESDKRFAGLPMVCIAAPIPTMLPPDEAIIQSTELSGASVFEEIVDIEAVSRLSDPVKDELRGLIKGFGDDLLTPDI